jgi:hypothetical protein
VTAPASPALVVLPSRHETCYLACGCIVQVSRVSTREAGVARMAAAGHAAGQMTLPVVTRCQRLPRPGWDGPEWSVTVRPRGQRCAAGRNHPSTYVEAP